MSDVLQCPLCELRFSTRSELEQHQALDHRWEDEEAPGVPRRYLVWLWRSPLSKPNNPPGRADSSAVCSGERRFCG